MKLLRVPSRSTSALLVGAVALVATTICAQQFAAARTDDATTTKLVVEMISRYHISQGNLNDEVSGEFLDRLMKELDPSKQYFTDADVQELNKYRNQLDDLLKVGNVELAYEIFDLYKNRVNARIAHAHKLIDADHDFTVDETMSTDVDNLAWAKSEAELNERWRKRIKNDLITFKLDEKPVEEAKDRLHKRYRMIQTTINQTEDHEKLEIYLSALAHTFDPHSSYMSPETLEDFRIQMRLSLDGIGAALRSEDGYTTVASIVPGGAADADGRLKVGDKVIGVGQAEGDIVDIVEMKLSKVVRLIRGPRGTKVRLQVKQADSNEIKLYELTRKKIELKSDEVKGEIIKTEDRLTGTQSRIGVINIPSFYRDFQGAQQGKPNFKSTARDVKNVLIDFRRKGVDAVIVDLRMNGGGALSEAIEVSGLFIDKGPIVQVKELNGRVKFHQDTDAGVYYAGPLVVVCNRLSASASEIFAGAIKDYRRGIVVGDESTHGKGTVQNVMPVSQRLFQFTKPKDRGALKLTINQFYRVNGDSTQHRGVKSDIVLPSLFDHMDLGESSLENALEFDQIAPARYAPVSGLINPQITQALAKASQARVARHKEFLELQEELDRFDVRRKRKEVSLNFQVRKEEMEKNKKADANPEEELKPKDPEEPIFPEGYYNNELLQITVDYLGQLKGLQTANN